MRYVKVGIFCILMFFGIFIFSGYHEVYAGDELIKGADIGWVSQLEKEGIAWADENGQITDPLVLLKEKGITAVRLRVFVNPPSDFTWIKPDGTVCKLGYVDTKGLLYTAKRANELGMKILLVFHYSDHFADPSIQDVPEQWEGVTSAELEKYVYDYTEYIMTQLKNENIYPEWVQIGNEVSHGMLFPTGATTNGFEQLTKYLNSGYDAVKAVSPNSQVVTHLTHGGGIEHFEWFFSNFLTQCQGKTDIIGMSYYPYWMGANEIENMTYNLNQMATKYGKQVMICETGDYETDPVGTYTLLRQELNALKTVANNKAIGVFYWEPEANSSVLPDGYPLGATKVLRENVLQFTSALDAFKTEPKFLDSECSFEIQNYNTGKALNVSAGSVENLANIEQYSYGKWDSQKWYFEKVEGNYYKIINKNSGKVLDIKGLSTKEGDPCIQYDDNGGWNQMWEIIADDSGQYKIKNRWSGLYLGIEEASEDNGAICVQVADDDSSNVKWYFLVTE